MKLLYVALRAVVDATSPRLEVNVAIAVAFED